MNAVVIMRALQLAQSAVTDLVGQRVCTGDVQQGTALPAVGIKEISRTEPDTVSRSEANPLITARVQVTVYAKSHPEQKALIKAIKLGAGTHTGTIAGVKVRSVLRDVVGPDLSDPAVGIYEQSRDFKVTYIEPD